MENYKRERVLKMVSMRDEGASYQEIANKFGITKQAAHQAITKYNNKEIHMSIKNIIYPNIKKWMSENECSMLLLSENFNEGYPTIRRYLTGKSQPRLDFIQKILEITGMKYEDAFAVSN